MKKLLLFTFVFTLFSCGIKPLKPENINGKWTLLEINNKELASGKNGREVTILLEIDTEKQKINGFDSCNAYFGSLKKLTNNEITIENIGSTRKACFGSFNANSYYEALKTVRFYTVKDARLKLLDEQKNEVLHFKK